MSRLIVLEGLDGSGKATQTARVGEVLRGRGQPVRQISFPNYDSPSSALVKMYLNGEFGADPLSVNPYQASIFYTVDRVAGYLKDWKQTYADGTTLLTDRYTTSNAIYQMSKLPREAWDDFLFWLEDLEYEKLHLPQPDVVLYLDVEPEVSQLLLTQRYRGDPLKKDIHERDVSFLVMCRDAALFAARKRGWIVVPCSERGRMMPVEHITEKIVSKL